MLQGFDCATEELRIELHLAPVPIERLCAMFDVGDDHDLCNAYPVDRTKADALSACTLEKIDTGGYDFFLQRYA